MIHHSHAFWGKSIEYKLVWRSYIVINPPVIEFCYRGLYGTGIAGILTLLFAKPGYMQSTAGTFYGQSPAKSHAQILAGKCENILVGLGIKFGIKRPAVLRYCGDDAEVKTWHLSPLFAPMGLGLQMTGA